MGNRPRRTNCIPFFQGVLYSLLDREDDRDRATTVGSSQVKRGDAVPGLDDQVYAMISIQMGKGSLVEVSLGGYQKKEAKFLAG